jgi:hypothetical protein
MHGNHMNEMRGFDLLSQPAQQRLRARVADADGDIAAVANEVRAELHALDRGGVISHDTSRQQQADRAFFVAQLTYLDLLARDAAQNDQPQPRGLLARLRTAFSREPAVDS